MRELLKLEDRLLSLQGITTQDNLKGVILKDFRDLSGMRTGSLKEMPKVQEFNLSFRILTQDQSNTPLFLQDLAKLKLDLIHQTFSLLQ